MSWTRSLVLAAGALLFAALAGASGPDASGGGASGNDAAGADASRPFVVKMHADWCGTCVKLNPVWERLEATHAKDARLVLFDVTDAETSKRSRAEAERLGLLEYFELNRRRTGSVAILDGKSREVVATMKGETDLAPYEEALRKARGSTS